MNHEKYLIFPLFLQLISEFHVSTYITFYYKKRFLELIPFN